MDSKQPFSARPSDPVREARPVGRSVEPLYAPMMAGQAPGMGVGDIYYILFRHKWRILLCFLVGVLAATALYFFRQLPYQSEAKLFIRYVVTEGKATGPGADNTKMESPDQRGETIMDSEQEILTSFDLAKHVADVVGPEKILARAGGGKDINAAAVMIKKGLLVDVPPRSSVIRIVFSHPDPEITQAVLREIIDQYLKMHVEIHRAVGIIGDFLTQETDQLRARLAQTEDELRRARTKAGVISLDDSKKAFSDQIAHIRQDIFSAQAELAERAAVYEELTKHTSAGPATSPATAPGSPATAAPPSAASGSSTVTPATASAAAPAAASVPAPAAANVAETPVPPEKIDEYRSVSIRLDTLQKRDQELSSQFTEENSRVKDVRAQLAETETAKRKLETDYPRLLRTNVVQTSGAPAGPAPGAIDLNFEAARLTALQSKIKVLSAQLDQIRGEASNVDQVEGSLQELKRKQELEEANYRYYSASLEQARINEALGTGKVSNISQIQTPSPPTKNLLQTYKLLAGVVAGGIGLGIAWAFLIEMYLDRTVRRPIDVERMLRVPLFLSIPAMRAKKKWFKSARAKAAETPVLPSPDETGAMVVAGGGSEVPPWIAENLRTFHETLRDRLIGYFESRNLTHKPKLVAVTGLGHGSGVTTTAAGLASCLSETGEGNVLLVDMTAGQGSAQQFYQGKQICGLEEILSTRDSALIQDKLYVVAEEPSGDKLSRILPQRFTKLVPKLKASNFDYIIFDMPPVSQISITPRLAGFMDMVLLVIESEKTDRELVQRATALLAESKAHVGAVLNKTQSYVPARLQTEYLGNM